MITISFSIMKKKIFKAVNLRIVFILNLKNRIFSLENILGCFLKDFLVWFLFQNVCYI